jgi:hypothetical protein
MTFPGLAPRGEDLRNVRYLFTDIDDTLTTESRLLPRTYQSHVEWQNATEGHYAIDHASVA